VADYFLAYCQLSTADLNHRTKYLNPRLNYNNFEIEPLREMKESKNKGEESSVV